MIELFINVSVIALLICTIFFCWRLNNKIIQLKDSRKQLLELIQTLDQAILKTNTNITDLKRMSQNSAVELNDLVTKAKGNINDLSFMNETAARVADRLEKGISEARYIQDKIRETSVVPVKSEDDIANQSDMDSSNDNAQGFRSSFSRAKEELISALRFVK